jgi:hypothetical protein
MRKKTVDAEQLWHNTKDLYLIAWLYTYYVII